MKFNQNEQITSISFRTDGSSIMVTGDVLGNIMVWDLEIKSMVKFFKGHEGSVIELCFLNGTNVLVSNGADNSIKQWVFDDEPRLLRFRSGHNASPTMMKFKGDKGRDILSVGGDCSLRMFSVIRDQQNVEFSQGKSERVTQVLDFDSNFLKERDWDNVITCHSKSNQAKTWNFSRKAIGKHTFTSTDNSFIKSVAISHCGNFGFIGSSNGVIDMFNMQSGLFRKSFVGHSKSITGLFTNEMSSKLFSTSLDGTFIIWDIQTSTSTIINLNSPISLSIANNDKSLIAITTDNLEIKVFDTTSLSLIRKFNGHRNRILSLCFSNDSRWIVSTSLDSTIRTWDLPTSSLIDCFKTDSIATSIAFSCTGEFLVTSHVGKLGLFLWSNKTLFTHVSIKVVDDSCVLGVGLPSAGTRQEDEPETNAFDTFPHVIVAEEMICLSTQPRSKWQNLLNINSIKKRNKPIGKVIEAPDAPFFLPTISGTVPKFKLDDVNESDSRIVKMMDLDVITEFIRLLRQGNSNGDCIYN